jgi:outer membrane protein OmpA-like peptidoglycan-associated protein
MKKYCFILSLLLLAAPSFAQDADHPDAEGCKDYPMFNRMPHAFIYECSKNFNQVEIPVSTSETKPMEGMKTVVSYGYTEEENTAPSFFQIVKNYENAVAKFGGKKVYYSAEAGMATLFIHSDGKDIWVVLQDFAGTRAGNFQITALEIEAMKQEISANAILDELNAKGSIALYINFETGKSAIKPESQDIIDEVTKMLKESAALKVSIEGHTDNVGKADANKKLSNDRAASVLAALAGGGIDKTRMQSKGWGQEKPIADNSTEDGRAKNRRVEIVKQ